MSKNKMKLSDPDVRRVARLVYKHSQEFDCRGLWNHVNIRIRYSKFERILRFLEHKHRLCIDEDDGIVFWVWNPKRIKRLIEEGLLVI